MHPSQPGSRADGFASNALSEADMAACVAYVDGASSHDERLAFELRLAAEPVLAAATSALLDTDRLLRTLEAGSAQQVARARRVRPFVWGGSLALAASVLIALGVYLLDPRERQAAYRVAVAAGYESSADYIASVPSLDGLRPPGLDVLRGSNGVAEAPNIDAGEFVERAQAAEGELARSVLDRAPAEITAGFFVVPLELARRSDVVVYALPTETSQPRETSLPRANEFATPVFVATLEAGRHVLPEERIALDDVTRDLVRYERGFLVPLGAGELDVVIGVRESTPAALVVAPIVRDSAQAARELESAGFAVRVLRVREPAD